MIKAIHLPSHKMDCDLLQLIHFRWELHLHKLTTWQLCLSVHQSQVASDARCMLELCICLG